jgi:hypothetical protein
MLLVGVVLASSLEVVVYYKCLATIGLGELDSYTVDDIDNGFHESFVGEHFGLKISITSSALKI